MAIRAPSELTSNIQLEQMVRNAALNSSRGLGGNTQRAPSSPGDGRGQMLACHAICIGSEWPVNA